MMVVWMGVGMGVENQSMLFMIHYYSVPIGSLLDENASCGREEKVCMQTQSFLLWRRVCSITLIAVIHKNENVQRGFYVHGSKH